MAESPVVRRRVSVFMIFEDGSSAYERDVEIELGGGGAFVMRSRDVDSVVLDLLRGDA